MKKLNLDNTSFRYLEKSFGEWLDILGYASSTVYNLPHHVREFLYYLENLPADRHGQGIQTINQLAHRHIKQYYDQLKERSNQRRSGALSSSYLNKHLQALNKFTDYLRQVGRLDIPIVGIRWEEEQLKSIPVLTVEEIRQLYQVTHDTALYHSKRLSDEKMEAIQSRDRAMLTIFYGCGLRRNEGYHLDIGDINFDRQLLHVKRAKGYKERYVPFNEANQKHLQEYIYDHRPSLISDKREGAFFISYMRRRMGGQSLLLRLKVIQSYTNQPELIEKEIVLHTLRHSIATHLLQAGMSLENISKFLGHSSLESTQIYTHLSAEALAKEDIAEAESEQSHHGGQAYNNIPKPAGRSGGYETTQLENDDL